MRKLILFFLISISFFNFSCVSQSFNWYNVIEAIIYVESRGDNNAVSKDGTCVGPMQIKKIVVDDCNEYCKIIGSNKRYTYDDRYNKDKSIEMFILIQKRYNKSNDIEKAIRIWNGGCNYSVSKTESYYQRVIKKYKANEKR